MYKTILTILLACCLPIQFLLSQEQSLSEIEIENFKEAILNTAKKTSTISCTFVQNKHISFLENDIKSSGNLYFKAPSWVKWEYQTPFLYSIIFKDDKLLVNDNGTKSAIDVGSSKMFKQLNSLIVNSVQGTMFSTNDFEISYFKSDSYWKAVFVPKDKKMVKMMAQIELKFDLQSYVVFEVVMREPNQDYTQILFSDRKDNMPLDDAIFTN